MKYHLITILLIVAALLLYVVGLAFGGTALLGAAVALEVWCWIRVFRGRPRHNVANDGQ
jgi:hypothetical protein